MPKRYGTASGGLGTTEADGAGAVPGVDPSGEQRTFRFNVDVDGEQFAVYEVAGGWSYDWLTGPNPGYGFGSFGPPVSSVGEHRESIRSFLRGIDPATGYLGDS
jgi:hypothetical protein